VPVRTYGGMGALRVAAALLRTLRPRACVYLPAAGWRSRRRLLETAGFQVSADPYLPVRTPRPGFAWLVAALCRMPERSVVVLRAPRAGAGALTRLQWATLADACKSMHHLPILELDGPDAESASTAADAVCSMVDSGVPFMLARLVSGRVAISLPEAAASLP